MDNDRLAKKRANEIRSLLGFGQKPVADIFSLLEELGIYLFKKPFGDDRLSALFVNDKKRYMIIINSSKTYGHQIFSAAHELSHYYFDKEILSGICSVNSNPKNEIEVLADLFAAHFIMPDDGVISVAENRKNKNGALDIYDIVFLQQYFKVSWLAMLKKLKRLDYIKDIDEFRTIGIKKLIYNLDYDPTLITKTNDTYLSKKYLEMVYKGYSFNEISETRAKKYLNDIGISVDDLSSIQDFSGGGNEFED